jgi:predicted nucleic acid-binding protein
VSFLLDTNILSAHLRRPAGLAHRFFQHSGRLYTSGVSLAELYDWVNGRRDPKPLHASIQRLLTHDVSPFLVVVLWPILIKPHPNEVPVAGKGSR